MSNSRLSITLATGLLAAAAILITNSNQLTAGKFFDQTGCSQCCPECNHCCRLDAEMGEEEKKCFEVEKEVVCIPRVVFPWQTGKGCCCLFPWSKKSSCDTCTSCDGTGCNATNRDTKLSQATRFPDRICSWKRWAGGSGKKRVGR